jgi:hypothetical protein
MLTMLVSNVAIKAPKQTVSSVKPRFSTLAGGVTAAMG